MNNVYMINLKKTNYERNVNTGKEKVKPSPVPDNLRQKSLPSYS